MASTYEMRLETASVKPKVEKGQSKTRAQTSPAPIRKKGARPTPERTSSQRQRYTDQTASRHWNLQLATKVVLDRHSIHTIHTLAVVGKKGLVGDGKKAAFMSIHMVCLL
jgi:hypothetical protein